MNKKIVDKLKKIKPTPAAYDNAKKVMKDFEKLLNKNKKLPLNKVFYVDQGWNYYTMGTFYEFVGDSIKLETEKNHYIQAPISDVFKKKQKDMKYNSQKKRKKNC